MPQTRAEKAGKIVEESTTNGLPLGSNMWIC